MRLTCPIIFFHFKSLKSLYEFDTRNYYLINIVNHTINKTQNY